MDHFPNGNDTTATYTPASATPITISVPSGAKNAIFTSTGTFYAQAGSTATASSDVTRTASVVNPAAMSLVGITAITILTAGSVVVSVTFSTN